MIHVDVRKIEDKIGYKYVVQTSTDGAGWKTQYVCHPQVGFHTAETEEINARQRAEDTARIMGVAWSYAGVEWRGTSCGYAL